ncbi:hypothetical protein FSP39_023979 [Pinctada imbricata]|uniref:Copper type II ascorbate-dependent monooxygenase N-terminal domain-containing protein n=1 Tax=Pinctada imbricata TaxID=66713 RepID=A0AA88Y6K6_PINIB|nr:hypothetical protein FSP39_023979 [Pinctada imbricata]
MMVYGCGSPGSKRPYWKCGEMDDRSESSVCSDGERQIVYAWALDASDMKFPPGFRVSGSTRIKYIVIQLHYKDAFEEFHAETACQYTGKPIVALAYRTHSHNLGQSNLDEGFLNRFHSVCFN